MSRIVMFCVVVLCSAAPAFSQLNATVTGTVFDSSGAVIPGVDVTALNVNTGIVTGRVSNEAGSYTFASLQPGAYTLDASLPGFQTARYENVQLSQGQQVRFNFTLQVAQAVQTIEVVSDADAVLAQTSASVGDALPDIEVRSLPLASRNVLDLIATTAGAVGNNFGGTRMSQVNTTRDGLPTSDGRFSDWNGVYSAIFTSPDLVEEVQVSVNTVDAAAGRGAGQVRLQTRSGTNDYNGALFYTNNNAALKAQNWFQNLVGAAKPYQNRNQFGGRIGGPIVRNKAFFFVLIDEQRFLEKENVVSTVFTAPARTGVFRFLTAGDTGDNGGTARRNGNAFSGTPSVDLAGNTLTSDGSTPLFINQIDLFNDVNDPNRTGIDQVWISPEYLPRMPLPNDWTVGDGLNTAGFRWLRRIEGSESATGTDPNTNRDHLSVRIDYQLDQENQVYFSMTREENWAVTGQTGLPSYPDGYFGKVQRVPDFYSAAWTSTISPTVLNEFRWGYKRDSWVGRSPLYRGYDFAASPEEQQYDEIALEARASFPEVMGQPFYINPGVLGLGTYASYGAAAPRNGLSPLQQYSDTISWTQGAHSFQAGFEATFANSLQYSAGGGCCTINPFTTLGVGNVAVPGVDSTNFPGLAGADVGTAEDMLAFLAGTVETMTHQYYVNDSFDTTFSDFRNNITRISDWHQYDWAAFYKDSWQVTNDLTLTLGIRYDKYGVPWDPAGIAGQTVGGQAGLFGISGTDFGALWNPAATAGSLTEIQFVGKNSPNPDTLVHQDDWNNFAPSVGFSWSVPWIDRTTIVRGGYGINYTGVPTFLQYTSQTSNVPGVVLNPQLSPATYLDLAAATDPGANLLPLDTGGALPLDTVPLTSRTETINGWADDKVVPYVQSFNLSVQHDLGRDLTLDVSYIGTKGTKLRGAVELNEPNIFENGILASFIETRAGGDALLFDQMLDGIDLGAGVGRVGVDNNPATGQLWTGSEALRAFSATDQWFANGDVASLAEWLNDTPTATGSRGGLLRTNGLAENFIEVNPQFGSVRLHGNQDSSIYHSLQTKVSKRFSNGFTGQWSYTWSKNLGNSLGGNGNGSDTTRNVRDPRNRNLQRGLLGFHRTHSVRANGTWELPFGPGRALLSTGPAWVHRIVEGWQLSAILSWDSGSPMSFSSSRETLAGNADTNTADLVGGLPDDLGSVVVGDGFVSYFPMLTTQAAPLPDFGADPNNLAGDFANRVVVSGGSTVLQNPEPGTTGTTSANLPGLEGPGDLGFDLAMSKRVQINETVDFTIRADAINVLNSPQWGNPNTDINSTSFGRITSASGERSVTINARIDF